MLVNIPDYEGLNNAALSQHFFAWEKTQNIISAFQESYPDEKFFSEEREEYIQQCQRDLRVYYSVIQQSNELALKAKLCKVSPFLLLLGGETKFKSSEKDIDFSSLRTLSAIDLVGVVKSLTSEELSDKFVSLFSDLRVCRNAMMHLDASQKNLEPNDLLRLLLTFYIELWPDRNWLSDRASFGTDGYEAYFDDGKHFTILGSVIREWSDTNKLISKGEFKKLFGITKSKRRYICFNCISETERGWNDWDSKSVGLAHLISKTKLQCLLCENEFLVERQPCSKGVKCKGDVIAHSTEASAGSCHTCSHHPFEI